MSQPQPAPSYYPPQPPKRSSTVTIIVVVLVVVALVIGLGAYGAYLIFQPTQLSSSATSTPTITVSGNSLTQTIPISTTSTVDVSCNYCTVTLQLSSPNVRADLNISGNYNHVTVNGGQTNIVVSGNYNAVNAQATTVLSVQNSGNGNTIQR